MQKLLTVITFLLIAAPILAQTELNYPKQVYGPENIKASWVSHPSISSGSDQVILFRNRFELKNASEDFIPNISAKSCNLRYGTTS